VNGRAQILSTEKSFKERKAEVVERAEQKCEALAPQEIEVLRLIGYGMQCKQIAFRLKIRPATVKHYTGKIAGKTGARCRGEMVRLALQAGLASLWTQPVG